MVGTVDKALARSVRAVPGTPLLYLNRDVFVIEPPQAAAKATAKAVRFPKCPRPLPRVSRVSGFSASANAWPCSPNTPSAHARPRWEMCRGRRRRKWQTAAVW